MGRISRVGLALLCFMPLAFSALPHPEEPKQTKVAEGQYRYSFSSTTEQQAEENWELYKTENGYLVRSQLRSGSTPEAMGVVIRSEYWLTRDLTILKWETRLVSSVEENTRTYFGCELGPNELRCYDDSSEARRPMMAPYDVLTMVPDPWVLMSVVQRFTFEGVGDTARASVVMWDVADGPEDLTPGEFRIRYVGEETLRVGEEQFGGRTFELIPLAQGEETEVALKVSLTPEGIPLAARIKGAAQEVFGFKLTRYVKYAEFGPGK